tara:strand:- start:3967 stop:5343 length:1377 start_codon:yes stop_codon:yes gene_type:complete
MSALTVDIDLIRKFNVPGPRYTSYPPATHFTDETPKEVLLEKIAKNNATSDRDLSLYFHLPFCESLCWFCGCTTVITTQQSKSAQYLDYIERELDKMGFYLNPDRKVTQIHLGGGTPTFLLPDEIRQLGEMVHSRFKVDPDMEASVEIDPRRLTQEKLAALREVGFNRASIGVQDNNPEVQKAVHRIQPLEMTREVVSWIREAGFQSLNIDLIYGLPHQTVESFDQTIDEILGLRPDRLAVFSYAHVPWIKPAQKILKDEFLPSPEVKLELMKLTVEKLTSNEFFDIGMDHFSRADDELAVAQREKTLQRNFQGYSTKSGTDIYSFGMSAISQADDIYWQNQKELPDYYADIDAGELPIVKGYVLTREDEIRRTTIMRLMCDLSLDYTAMSNMLGLDFAEHFAGELASLDDLEEGGLLQRLPGRLEVTDLGRLFIRIVAMRFDAYMIAGKEGRYSKAI